jgi:hypothetical protein
MFDYVFSEITTLEIKCYVGFYHISHNTDLPVLKLASRKRENM